jgi:hypothetical protein
VLDLPLAFSAEALVGWRVWRIFHPVDRAVSARELALELLEAERRGEPRPVEAAFSPRLFSLSRDGVWPPGRSFAGRCDVAGSWHPRPPDPGCECGVWAFKSPDDAVRVAREARGETALAVGRVALWGRAVEFERGWRTRFAYPVDAAVHGAGDVVAQSLADAYGVPVVSAREP